MFAQDYLWAPLVLLVVSSHFPSKAQDQVPAPKRLRFKAVNSNTLLVAWKEPKGDFDSYLFLYNSIPGGHQREIIISKSDSKVLITDYDPSKDYIFSVISVRGSTQSKPLQGRHKAERGEGGGGVKTQPQRLTDSFTLPEDVNEISGVGWDCDFYFHAESLGFMLTRQCTFSKCTQTEHECTHVGKSFTKVRRQLRPEFPTISVLCLHGFL
ncbi:collagen alpha-1(XIV) chain-like isoform X2 [Entelurus aequoreus]|nr:collagen alpha-1(XIV) chain-like isoform X2 [Entelurus aequoreus]